MSKLNESPLCAGTHVEGPFGQKTCRTIFLASSSFLAGVQATGVLRFAMINPALHRPIFLATVEPIFIASDGVRGCGRVDNETYALSSH